MKNNRKNRKLKFIRGRNALGRGRWREAFKITEELLRHEDCDVIIAHKKLIIARKVGKVNRCKAVAYDHEIGYDGHDFINMLRTILVKLKRV